MKKVLLSALLIASIQIFSQKKGEPILPTIDDKVVYTEVVQVDSAIKKEELYARAKRFFIDIYNSGKDVIQLDDKETGEVTGKGFFTVILQTSFLNADAAHVWHTLSVYVKDGKYKYEMKDFRVKYHKDGKATTIAYIPGSDTDNPLEVYFTVSGKGVKKFLVSVSEECKKTIEKLKSAMGKKAATDF